MARSPLFGPVCEFFEELAADNTAAFFQRERPRYDAARAVFSDVCDGIDGYGPWRIYRPHNDRRFRPDTAPYKTFLGAVAERRDGVGAFVQVSARGVLIGSGMPMPAKDQLPRWRGAVADEASGEQLVRAIAVAERRGAVVHGGRWPPLQRVPRGYPPDAPRDDLLRWKGIEANVRVEVPPWRSVAEAVAAIDRALDASSELAEWIGRHVGPSQMSPEERFAPTRRRNG
jgi:uncharacterized protein (DUF2461 family)